MIICNEKYVKKKKSLITRVRDYYISVLSVTLQLSIKCITIK